MDKALRFNSGKPELHYILYYPKFVEALALVHMQGAEKYGYGNWRLGGKPSQEYWDSAMRHIFDAFQGKVYDEDTGCLTLAHAIWNLIQIIEQNMENPLFDGDFDQESFIERWKDFPKNSVPLP